MMKGGHGPTKWLSKSNCGAFDHASHAPQSLSDNYYLLRHASKISHLCKCTCRSVAQSTGFNSV